MPATVGMTAGRQRPVVQQPFRIAEQVGLFDVFEIIFEGGEVEVLKRKERQRGLVVAGTEMHRHER